MVLPAESLIGHSPAIETIRQLIAKLAASSLPVLIQGETGTGKEVIAKQVHARSARARKPFVVVDCAALTPFLMETELFGYSKGAFTGADTQHLGLLITADGGTLFLDEVGELPLLAQSRLLRVIQEHEFRPVGAIKSVPVDARIIAATSRDLEAQIAAGEFRTDLYFRLNVINIHVPALRERRSDITLLAQHFLRSFDCQGECSFDDEMLAKMTHYDWPGNVRELRNFAEKTATLGVADFDRDVKCGDPAGSPSPEGVLPLTTLELQTIRRALLAAGGNRAKAAKLLGIGKTTLYRKLKQLDLAG
jgi:DNA-binding NtrC family response regulator